MAFIGDRAGNVRASTRRGARWIWKAKVDDHPLARVTGSPVFHNGRLYVPVASGEETAGAASDYECCRFRGSVVAFDGATGVRIWKTLHDRGAATADAEEQGRHADVGTVGSTHLVEPGDRHPAQRPVRHHGRQLQQSADRHERRASSRSTSIRESSCGPARC